MPLMSNRFKEVFNLHVSPTVGVAEARVLLLLALLLLLLLLLLMIYKPTDPIFSQNGNKIKSEQIELLFYVSRR